MIKKYIIDNEKLMKEWDFKKNSNINPENVALNSKKKAWWMCEKGHSYLSRIDSRNAGTGCPYCSGNKVLSGFNDLATKKPNVINEWDYSKNDGLLPNEITAGSAKKVYFVCKKGHEYLMKVRDYYSGYNCPICMCRIIIPGINDLASYDKRIMKEWNYKKNKKIDPQKISPNSSKKVWWIGECGHEWHTSIYSRTKMNTNCPICAEERHASVSEKSVLYYLKKFGRYEEIYENYKDEYIKLELDIYIPSIRTAIEYDGERWHKNINKDLNKDIMCQDNNIKLIRIRECGTPEYDSTSIKILMTQNKNKGLEEAINKLLKHLQIENVEVDLDRDKTAILSMINFMTKENSILIKYPELSKEWHPSKNGNLKPQHTKEGSNKKVWWLGRCGHEWQAVVHDRVAGDNCPYCSGHRVLKGFNDLETKRPDIAKEWNYHKNGDLTPNQVTIASSKKVWWIGKCGHEWQATISHRTVNNRSCPYCSGNKVLAGFNDLATLNSKLVAEWDYEKNTSTPSEYTLHSGAKVWWKCKICEHEWQATIDKRSNGRGCPNCANIKKDKC